MIFNRIEWQRRIHVVNPKVLELGFCFCCNGTFLLLTNGLIFDRMVKNFVAHKEYDFQ